MKKLIVMGIVLVMALSASAAFAAIDNDWLINFKASTDALVKTGASTATFGVKTAAGDQFNTLTTATALGGSPEVNYADATHPYTTNYNDAPATAKRYFIAKKGGAPLTQGSTLTWTFKVAGSAGATIYLTAWQQTGTSYGLDAGDQVVKLFASNAAGEKVGAALWTFTPGNTTTWAAATGIAGTAGVNFYQQQITLGAADSAGGAYSYFLLEASTVPEPGSMVALFSGLVGLVGFGIRRRK